MQKFNNNARIRELRRYATPGLALVFDLVPILLNVNDPQMPGYVDDPQTPYGVKFVERQLWRPKNERVAVPATKQTARPAVESLFLIGSVGSVGHSDSSDLDYWVCFDPEIVSPRELDLLRLKLKAVTEWARDTHRTEANFYTINITDLLKGRFPKRKGAETEGEVAPRLLLEELYRTFVYVAGRLPAWWGLPSEVDDGEKYNSACRALLERPNPIFIDLGFPFPPSPQEMLAEALWLARKSEANPFKGIIKMATLLAYVESDPPEPLLCSQVKEAILSGEASSLPVDPYVMTIDRVVQFGEDHLTPEQLNLLQVSALLKVIGGADGRRDSSLRHDSPKAAVLERWARQWGWSRERFDHILKYNQWPGRERMRLDGELLNMLASVYIRIAQYLLHHYPGQVNPQEEELAPLAARLLARMGGLESTIETLPSEIHRHNISRQLVLYRNPVEQNWQLYAITDRYGEPEADNLVYSGPRAARVAAWLVHNHIYGPETELTIRNAESQADIFFKNGFNELLKALANAFPPFELTHADLDNLWSPGGHGPVLLTLNLELPAENCHELLTVDVIMRTGWGEMRHYYIWVGDQERNADKYLKIANNIFKESGGKAIRPAFLAPPTLEMRKAAMNIKGALAASGKRGQPVKKIQIDLGIQTR